MGGQFSWIPAYEAIATKLLEYEDRQDELCQLVEEILGEHFNKMDPLTFFSMFNGKRRNDEKRIEAVRVILGRFELNVAVPSDFDGVPISNPQRWRYWDGAPDTVRNNWSIFQAALDYADGKADDGVEFAHLFDVVHSQGNVGDASLTMALYWVRPRAFIPMDKNTALYLRNRYGIAYPKPFNGDGYVSLLKKLRTKSNDSFPDISYAAWELGGWIPAPSEYDPGITVDTWEELLRDPGFAKGNMLIALKCLSEHPEGVTCTELAESYGREASFYNSNVTNVGKQICERTGILPCKVEKLGKYWPILCVGSFVGAPRNGSFKWRLRPELDEAIKKLGDIGLPLAEPNVANRVVYNPDKLARLRALYKKDFPRFRVPGSGQGDQEAYKWNDICTYREHWDIDADDFAGCLRRSLQPAATGTGQLLGDSHTYSLTRLLELAEFDPESIRKAFKELYKPGKTMRSAYYDFVEAVEDVMWNYSASEGKPFKTIDQTPSAVSVYLSFEKPEQFHIFKPSIGSDFAACIGAALPIEPVTKMLDYERLADTVLPELLADKELVALCDGALNDKQRAIDPGHHLLLQDVAHYSARYMPSWHPDWKEILSGEVIMDEYNDVMHEGATYPMNLILYGPPGTGKTYQSRAYAVAICDGRNVEDVLSEMATSAGYAEVANRYDRLVSEGRVGFTTFHQSYGYEEFIEGLRPEYDEDKGVIAYPLRKGAFRDFCEAAEDTAAIESAENSIPRFENNPRPRVWKMGLNTNEVPGLLDRCRAEGALRMGWDDVAPNEVGNSEDLSEANRRAINAFQEEMQPGDFVVIPGAGGDRYDVAVITGDFEWDDNASGAKRRRSAQWLDGVDKRAFVAINGGKILTLQTVYELTRVSPSKLLELMGVHNENAQPSHSAKPYVFIIDEINRGNISKIFGELITLIEPNKRKGAVEETLARLPYSGELFGVPSNVHVLGTMNTADRSIALMDTALRRRFEFIEVMPDPSLFSEIEIEEVDISRMLETMNKRIELLYDREHTLGHAYLMGLKDDPSIERLAGIFETRFMPLLQEYFFDDYAKIRLVLGAAADCFIEEKEAHDVFWGDDAYEYDRLRSYRVLPAPREAEAYKLIYKMERGG
ncbi:AAA family ATPase [Slackia heliotrinireducens]|uniref:AAA family ATPase n=1 Tax=Slackia heliotrinireducens TaxID=84110 RepID=UPI0033153F37